MPFLADEHFPIPTQDILSYYFDEPQFDQHKPLYIDALNPDRFWTAAQCRKAIRQLASGFKAAGLLKGDCVCIHSFNDLNYSVAVNGIAGFGGVYTGTNPAYQTYELIHHLKASKARLIIVQPDLLDNITAAAKEVGIPASKILIFDDQGKGKYKSWKSLFEHGEIDWPRFNDLGTSKNTTLARLFSSGTTGLPKAAQLSHYNLIAEHRLFTEWNPSTWERRRIMILPMFHAATAPLAHYASLRSGDQCFIAPRFDLETYFKVVERFQITEGAFVPPVIHAIINSPLSKQYSLKSIRIGHCGAAPVDKWSQSKLKKLIPEAQVTQVWGMTETSCTCSMTRYPLDESTGSVGNMLPNMDAKLVDDDGNDISGYDRRGELCVRGPLVCQGYFENPEANARDWDSDGFFHTGDIAYRDGKSKLWYIVDRKKELIKVRGFQVSPSELEAVLLQHPKVGDVAVIGVPSTTGSGETPLAYIVKRPDIEVTEGEIKEYIGKRLAKYKQLGRVIFIDALPKSASGKLLKRILREDFIKMQESQVKPRL